MLRWYGWNPPAISLGRHEPYPTGPLSDPAGRSLPVVRRPTGGRAILHGHEITYALIVPERFAGGPRKTFARVHGAIVEGLRALGVDARSMGPSPALPPSAGPCFGHPAEGEIIFQGQKLVGSAQARIRHTLLQHGSILVGASEDQFLLPEFRDRTGDGPATITRALGREPDRDELIRVLCNALSVGLGIPRESSGGYREGELRARAQLEEGLYAHPLWNRTGRRPPEIRPLNGRADALDSLPWPGP